MSDPRKPCCAVFPRGYLPLDCPSCGRLRLLYGVNDKGGVIYVECEKCGANSDDETFPQRGSATVVDAFALAVALARAGLDPDPEPGDLVVETSWVCRGPDPDGIGWLVAHGEAAYAEDGTGPTREVWDVTPLTGALGADGRTYQRWENADFQKVPDFVVRRLQLLPPEGWASDFAWSVRITEARNE